MSEIGLNKEQHQKLLMLKDQKSKLKEEAGKLIVQRDQLNARFRALRSEADDFRRERDASNKKVVDLKKQRSLMKDGAYSKIEKLKKIRMEAKGLLERKPERSEQSLRADFEKLEWQIQTESLCKEEEKQVLSRVKQLELQLNVYKKVGDFRHQIDTIEAELKMVNAEEEKLHSRILSIAKKSQMLHEKMLIKVQECKTMKTEADRLHKSFLETVGKSRELNKEIVQAQALIRHNVETQHREEDAKRKKEEESIRSELEKKAKEKLRQGEKLTWEEFQVLAEKGGIQAQD